MARNIKKKDSKGNFNHSYTRPPIIRHNQESSFHMTSMTVTLPSSNLASSVLNSISDPSPFKGGIEQLISRNSTDISSMSETAFTIKEKEIETGKGKGKHWSEPYTCRHRSTRFLLQNSHEYNQSLKDALARYTRFHDKALRNMPIKKALEIPLTSLENNFHYLVWIPSSFVEKSVNIQSLISSFLLSLMTDRVLLVYWNGVEELLCEPFVKSTWTMTKDLYETLTRTSSPSLTKIYRQREPTRKGQLQLKWNGGITMDDDKHVLQCHGSIKGLLTHIEWIIISGDSGPFIEYLMENPSHRSKMEKWFPNNNPYTLLMQHLIHPHNFIWERITWLYQGHFGKYYDQPRRYGIIGQPKEACIEDITNPLINSNQRIILYSNQNSTSIDGNGKMGEILKSSANLIYGNSDNSQSNQGFNDNNSNKPVGRWLDDWRKFFTDIWMQSLTNEIITEEIDYPNSFLTLVLMMRNDMTIWNCESKVQNEKNEKATMEKPTIVNSHKYKSLIIEPFNCTFIRK